MAEGVLPGAGAGAGTSPGGHTRGVSLGRATPPGGLQLLSNRSGNSPRPRTITGSPAPARRRRQGRRHRGRGHRTRSVNELRHDVPIQVVSLDRSVDLAPWRDAQETHPVQNYQLMDHEPAKPPTPPWSGPRTARTPKRASPLLRTSLAGPCAKTANQAIQGWSA